MEKVAFLDRDGVINVNIGKHCYVNSWDQFIFIAGAVEGIKRLNRAGYKVVIVTNQSGIAQNLMTVEQLEEVHKYLRMVVKNAGGHIDQIYYCPHARTEECSCRKPKIGMFLQAEKLYDMDKSSSFMLGDSSSDMEAAKNYGIAGYLFKDQDNLVTFIENILAERCGDVR
jgi:histidinol-phosphate phosphatase family domain/HAD-superfamily hydrolase, subfamily IIIA